MKLNILIDTGFWIALFDPKENLHYAAEAERIAEEIEDENIIIPFPTLYEFVNSRLSRRDAKIQFENILKRQNVILLDDNDYKDEALVNFFENSKKDFTDISLVDEILKLIIADPKIKVHYIASFDSGLVNAAIARGVNRI